LPWHCSRDVSRLFTKINFEEYESGKYFNQIPENPEKYDIHFSKNCNVAGFKFKPKDKIYIDLDEVNELVYTKKE